MVVETRKILDPDIAVHATCVRVPVFVSHGEAVNVEFANPVDENAARNALKKAEGVIVVDHRANEGYVTPVEATGEDAVYVSRIRKDPTVKNGLAFWCVADNLRKGAALNAVQIAEVLARDFVSSFLLTMTNPATMLAAMGVFAALGALSNRDPAHAGELILGVFGGSTLWWLILSSMAGAVRSRCSPHWLDRLNHGLGVILTAFGLIILAGVALRLL